MILPGSQLFNIIVVALGMRCRSYLISLSMAASYSTGD
jgi:hypothetical protein